MVTPYYQDAAATLYHGRMEDVLPELGELGEFDACVTDPPYEETSLAWDRWPGGWPALVAEHTRSMWCFGSMRMFLDRRDEFTGWRMSQDVVWEKPHGSGVANDRFRRVHEHALHWYRGRWDAVHHEPPRTVHTGPPSNHGYTRVGSTGHTGNLLPGYRWTEDGTRLMRSVIEAKTMWRRGAIHKTEKSPEILTPLIEYAVPPGGTVLDVFAGSCSTLLTARRLGRHAVGIEGDEAMCEKAVTQRLSVHDLFSGGAA